MNTHTARFVGGVRDGDIANVGQTPPTLLFAVPPDPIMIFAGNNDLYGQDAKTDVYELVGYEAVYVHKSRS